MQVSMIHIVELFGIGFLLFCIIDAISKNFFVKDDEEDNYINYDKKPKRRR